MGDAVGVEIQTEVGFVPRDEFLDIVCKFCGHYWLVCVGESGQRWSLFRSQSDRGVEGRLKDLCLFNIGDDNIGDDSIGNDSIGNEKQ